MPEPLIESNKQRLGKEVEPQIEELVQRAERAVGVLERKEVGLKRKVRDVLLLVGVRVLPDGSRGAARESLARSSKLRLTGLSLLSLAPVSPPAAQLANPALVSHPPAPTTSAPSIHRSARPRPTAADERKLAMLRGRKERLRMELAALEGGGDEF